MKRHRISISIGVVMLVVLVIGIFLSIFDKDRGAVVVHASLPPTGYQVSANGVPNMSETLFEQTIFIPYLMGSTAVTPTLSYLYSVGEDWQAAYGGGYLRLVDEFTAASSVQPITEDDRTPPEYFISRGIIQSDYIANGTTLIIKTCYQGTRNMGQSPYLIKGVPSSEGMTISQLWNAATMAPVVGSLDPSQCLTIEDYIAGYEMEPIYVQIERNGLPFDMLVIVHSQEATDLRPAPLPSPIREMRAIFGIESAQLIPVSNQR